ncbi:MAG TPA: S9 family peptidase [Blastocatellia bacterium]|nr:S9 family peptidase [Blastocatellia bacterium]
MDLTRVKHGGSTPLIPKEQFFRDPEKIAAQISPDGSRISYISSEGEKLYLFICTIGTEDNRIVAVFDQGRKPLYFWSRDGKRILYLRDQAGDENYHLYCFDVNQAGMPARDLTPFEGVRAEILRLPRQTPEEILIYLNNRNPQIHDVYSLNLSTGGLELMAENPGNIAEWLVNSSGQLRVAVALTPDGIEILARDTETGNMRSVARYKNEDEVTTKAITPDGNGLYLRSAKDSDFSRLLRLDLNTREEVVIDQDDEADLLAIITSDKTNELLGAIYLKGRAVYHIFDSKLEEDFKALHQVHEGNILVPSRDAEEENLIVVCSGDVDPGTTYLYDRSTREATFLYRSHPWLNPDHLAPMKPIKFRSRDGLTLHGYLTIPRDAAPMNLPMVLNVHGGPWQCDTWGYNGEVQFLANRGYAVLQVNYRGSTGHGKKFQHAAIKEFAGKMQDDLIDGVNWAINQGIADPARVAIYGFSYGGYAALVGMTFTPDVFACGIALCGPSNLITLIKSFPPYAKPFLEASWYRYIGNPDDPETLEDLKERSPLFRVHNLKRPLLIAQGANDPRVNKAESHQIVEAMRSAGKEVEYMLVEGEGHGFQNPVNRLEFYARMEAFLAKHLGGRTEGA